MADPRDGFVAEAEVGIQIKKREGIDYLILMRFSEDEKVMDYTAVPLAAFMKYSVRPGYMKIDNIARQEYERDERIRLIIGLPSRKIEEWYVMQPMVLELTDGSRTWHYRMTFHNWMTCELEMSKILGRAITVIPMELAVEHTREQGHKLKEA